MVPLHGIGVLVTRPEQQAALLCSLLHAQGAATLRLPAIEIKPCDQRAIEAQMGAPRAVDLFVFTSANAVRFGSALLEQRRGPTLAAIGPATARALKESGYKDVLQPGDGFDSEALLRHPRLKDLSGQRVLLIKGSNGRQVLEQEMIKRGADVVCVDVYERSASHPSTADLAAVHLEIEQDRLHVITATSLDIGARLLDMNLGAEFQRLHWLVPGERVASALRRHGLRAPLLTAASADDQDLVATLLRWRSGESSA